MQLAALFPYEASGAGPQVHHLVGGNGSGRGDDRLLCGFPPGLSAVAMSAGARLRVARLIAERERDDCGDLRELIAHGCRRVQPQASI